LRILAEERFLLLRVGNLGGVAVALGLTRIHDRIGELAVSCVCGAAQPDARENCQGGGSRSCVFGVHGLVTSVSR